MGSIYNTSLNTMAKTNYVTATMPDGTVLKRRTDRQYTHVIVRKYKHQDLKRTVTYPNGEQETFIMDRWGAETWIGRPDLVAARWEGFKNSKHNFYEFLLFETNNENTGLTN